MLQMTEFEDSFIEENPVFDSYWIYGAMDRACIECQNVGRWLCEDEYIQSQPDLLEQAMKAHDALFDLYQKLSKEFFNDNEIV